jgi:hypothetical protein
MQDHFVRYPGRTGRRSLALQLGLSSLSAIPGPASAGCEVESNWSRYRPLAGSDNIPVLHTVVDRDKPTSYY